MDGPEDGQSGYLGVPNLPRSVCRENGRAMSSSLFCWPASTGLGLFSSAKLR